MTTEQILNSLSESQRKELDENVIEVADKISADGSITPDKLGEVNVNLRFDNDTMFLNATILFFIGESGKLTGRVIKLIKFDTVDEYLDSISSARKLGEDWKTIK